MKTLVMFEAFGGRLTSEPEIYELGPGQFEINLPFTRVAYGLSDRPDPIHTTIKVARFRFVERVQVPGWKFPVRKFVMVDV